MIKDNFPYLEEDLLTSKSFVSYCKKRGIDIDEKFLEYLHKEGLIYPVIRLIPGINRFKKIKDKDGLKYVHIEDIKKFSHAQIFKKNYYGLSSFSYGKKNTLEHYKKNRMLEYPITDKKFVSWDNYKDKSTEFFTENMTILKNYRILLYSKKQIYLIKEILEKRYRPKSIINISINNEIEHYGKALNQQFKWFDESFINNTYNNIIIFFTIYQKTISNYESYVKYKIDIVKSKTNTNEDAIKLINSKTFINSTENDYIKINKKNNKPKGFNMFKNILEKYIIGYKEQINNYTFIKMNKKILNFKNNLIVSNFVEEILIPCELYIRLFDTKYKRITSNLMGNHHFINCRICGRYFEPKNINVINCSSKCTYIHKSIMKKEKRKSGEYKY